MCVCGDSMHKDVEYWQYSIPEMATTEKSPGYNTGIGLFKMSPVRPSHTK